MMMSNLRIALLFTCLGMPSEAINLRSRELAGKPSLVQKGEDPIPDPKCKKGVMSPDMKVCCSDECGSCGNHALCSNVGEYHEVTGQLADNCCKDRVLTKAASCDKNHPPCVLSASYKSAIAKWVEKRPKRHAKDDCTKAVPMARASHALSVEKGEFFSKLYLEGKTKYEEAQATATKVMGFVSKKTDESKELMDEYAGKVAKATKADKEVDPLSGFSRVEQWKDAGENEEAEVSFYGMITKNGKEVYDMAAKGLNNQKKLQAEVEKVHDVQKHHVQLNALIDDANRVYADAELLMQQWLDSAKDYNCGAPPGVAHVDSQCDDGNTKYSRKCSIVCALGYDGKGTQNAFRCNKQGKFGKQLYGEWAGMATCVGRVCGKPPAIAKTKTVVQDIRYPHAAGYNCYEGFSMNRNATGPKSFDMQCGPDGRFETKPSQVCKAITCGDAPAMKFTHPIETEFTYTQVATYKCLFGHTLDSLAGGLTNFSRVCQATGRFTEGEGCQPVRCGAPPTFDNTKLDAPTQDDRTFGDELHYACDAGHSINQEPSGPDHFTLVCQADGEFALKDTNGEVQLPKCRPVSAGMAPTIAHGNFNPREMFYGETVYVSADVGYSTSAHPEEGLSFVLNVTTEGTYVGEEKFLPVDCGKPPSVSEAKSSFKAAKASYGDLLSYECTKGYSTDMTAAESATSFSVECEADGSFSKVPDLGKCVNVDDCADHTCGPHGDCVDHLQNYTCACQSGYEQTWDNNTDELLCGNIDDCGPEACGVGECEDLVNGYKCDCPTGYEQKDTTNEDGKEDHTCKAVTCGTPPIVDDTATTPVEVQVEKIYYTGEVVYQCDLGFTLDGKASGKNHFDIECLATKAFTDTKSCSPIKCDTAPKVDFSVAKKTAATFNESIRYDCVKGHSVDGTAGGDRGFTITCQLTGLFGEPQSCSPISCGEPDTLANAVRPSGSLVYGESIDYDCANGFTLDGKADGPKKFKTECHEDGSLDKLKQCVPIICGEPPKEIDVLFATADDEGDVKYPQSSVIMCRDGYTVGGEAGGVNTFVVSCLSNGEFEKVDKRECKPVECGTPPALANATLFEIKTPTPAKGGVTRYAFYAPMGSTMPDVNKKDKSSCPKSHPFPYHGGNSYCCRTNKEKRHGPSGAKCDGSALHAGGVHSMCCDNDDYLTCANPPCNEFVGDHTDVVDNINSPSWKDFKGMTRQENWAVHFSGALMIKKAGDYQFELTSDDGSLLYINGKTIVNNDGLHGMVAKKGKLSLVRGPHALIVDMFQKGGGAGLVLKWKGADSNDKWEVVPASAFQTKGGHLNYEEKAVYECNAGFTTGGEYNAPTKFNVECLPTGEMSFPSEDSQCRNVDDCEQHTCGPKGQCIDLVGPSPAYTCKCDHGYEMQTNAKGEKYCGNVDDCQGKDCGVGVCKDLVGDYTCQCPSGYYIGFNPDKTCMAVQCSADTPSLENGRLLSDHTGAVDFPATLRYKCDVGYSIDGMVAESSRKFQAQCKSDGQLFGMMSCQKISCGTPHVLPFTRLLVPGSPRRSVEYADKAEYECFTGYTLGGRSSGKTTFEVQCKDDGVLTDPEVCEPVRCGRAPRVSKARPGIAGNVYYGQSLVYSCDLGYTFDSTPGGRTEFQRQCLSSGQFSALADSDPCHPVSPGEAPQIRNADWVEYAGQAVAGLGALSLHQDSKVVAVHPAIQVFYPKGLEYRCKPGYSTNGQGSGPTKITSRVNSMGTFTPALPVECKRITFYVRGRIKNARNGWALSGVKVCVQGTSNCVTSRWGFFTLRNIAGGAVKLTYQKSGYIANEKTLSITGNINSGGVADVSTSPTMRNDQYRAVVTWGRRPSDLDSYAMWGWTRVCWYGTRRWSNRVYGVLEQDKTAGYGPETVYFSGVGRCRGGSYFCDIKYMVNDYTRSGSMLRDGKTEVTLYNGNRVAGTWKITDCPRSVFNRGNWWHVFTINARTNRLKWSCAAGSLIQTEMGDTHGAPAPEDSHIELPRVEKPQLRVRRIAQ